MSKRKGTDVPMTMSSTVSVSYDEGDFSWTETRQKLKDMRSSYSANDMLASFRTCLDLQSDLENQQSHVVQESENIKSRLENRIEMAREACKEESDDLYRMQVRLEHLQADRQALHQALEELDGIETETRERIIQCQEVASEQIESIDQVEAERMRQVPRLKQQISLYATTTGIKWDFDEEDVLAGQVVRI